YLLLNLGSVSVPFLYSFHPRLKLHKRFLWIFISILLTMFIFIPWDVIFTMSGIWGFNDTYFLGCKFLSLPIEEWLFFICIPFACVFTHYALLLYFPNLKVNKTTAKKISIVLILLLFILAVVNYDKWYTVINFGLAIPLTLLVYKYNTLLLQQFFLTFLVMLIPFFIVNGILTGSFIEDQVVWYNNAENLGIRMATIPVEDSIYAYSMILCNLFLTELFVNKYYKTSEI
ncbi:MAG: lycopene cyclase domain-containing protein, partial [Flavobacteriaceae bacterium]|nr:lycopene cyclase domain-containing protein [Flavobacteriaceae bacterium]